MPDTPRDQPSNVSTEETRPTERVNVVTSDLPPQGASADPEPPTSEPRAGDPGEPAAPPADKPEGQTTDDPAPSDDKQTSAKRDRRAESRIKAAHARLAKERERNNRNESRIAELEQEIRELRAATPAKPEPQLADFDNPREYAKAYARWESEQTQDPAAPPATRQPVDTRDSRPEPAPPDKEIASFHTRGKEKLGDEFTAALLEPDTAINQQMAEFIMDSDVGPEIYVHLANNVEESRKIYDSGPDRAKAMLDELAGKAKKGDLDVEGSLHVETETAADEPGGSPPAPDDPKADKPGNAASASSTRAPTPPSDTADRGGSSNLQPDPENEDMDDYAARRRKEEARRRGYPV